MNPKPAAHFDLPLSIEARNELDDLTQTIIALALDPLATDDWIPCWGEIDFKPRKFYMFMFRNVQAPSYITMIWKSKCIMRHKVFAWHMLMDKVNTRGMLLRRHFFIGDDHACLMCASSGLETTKHLFFECEFAGTCWDIVGMHWNPSLDMQDMFDWARTTWQRPLFKEVAILTAWNIWKQRNKMLFDGEQASHLDWLRMLKADLEILKFRLNTENSSFLHGFTPTLIVN